MVNYQYQEGEQIRCGWTISRTVAPAVIRNRLRRWGREFFRAWTSKDPVNRRGLDFNLIFKKQEQDFYRRLDHTEFNDVLGKVVSRFENA
jgi:ribonuclease P protein component